MLFHVARTVFGSWQIQLSNNCKERRIFVCRFSTFQFEVMPFGLINAPSRFQKMTNDLIGRLKFVKVYLNDVVIFSQTMENTSTTFSR